MNAAGWEEVALGCVATFHSGRTPSRARETEYFARGSVPWVKTMDLTNGVIRVTHEKVTPLAVAETGMAIHPAETVLVAMYGGFAQIGRTGILGTPAATNQAITAIRCVTTRLEPRFLAHTLNYRVGYWRSVASSSRKDPNITKDDIRSFPLLLPPIAEQVVIADVLSNADDLAEALEGQIAKQEAIKQGLKQQLLTGRTRLPGFDGPWVQRSFGTVAYPSRERVLPAMLRSDVPLVELEHMGNGTGDLLATATAGAALSHKTLYRSGDVLFGKLRSYLRKYWLATHDGLCSTEIWALRVAPGIAPAFVRYTVESEPFIQAASGATGTHMPRADWGVVRELEVNVPPLDEQQAIARVLADADAELAALRTRLRKARTIKGGMMQELLTGRTRLTFAEPNDRAETRRT